MKEAGVVAFRGTSADGGAQVVVPHGLVVTSDPTDVVGALLVEARMGGMPQWWVAPRWLLREMRERWRMRVTEER